jgi:UDP-3-O-[3-hydroxymyristoyl] glucosamine N-acyltransferase
MSYTIAKLARLLGLPYQGEGNHEICKVSSWDIADSFSLIFLEKFSKGESLPAASPAGCIIAPSGLVSPDWNAILSEKPKMDFARAAGLLHPPPQSTGLHHCSAIIAPDAALGVNVEIGPYVTIGPGARIDDNCILHAGVAIGECCVLGKQCILYPRVVLYRGAVLKNRVILHAGVVVGSDGFGYVFDGQKQVKFPQVGEVIIEDDVEIGANTTVDRGSLGVTRIGRGAKIDNLVQIAHNVKIGEHVVIAAQTGISGSTVIEEYAVIGGQVGFGDHARVEKGAIIGSKAGVLPGKIVRGGEVYWGVPVRPLKEYKVLNALFGKLPEMKADIEALKEKTKRHEGPEEDRSA